MQATQKFSAMPVPIIQTIRGEVSDATSRYAVNLNWNGSRIEGQLGGWWFPEKVLLERSPHGLIGYVNSRSVHLTINVTLHETRLELLIASRGHTETMALELGNSTGVWRSSRGLEAPIDLEQTLSGYVIQAAEQRVTVKAPSSLDWVVISAGLVSFAAQRAVSNALLESLKELREQ